jgi:general secretion pathway protein I
VKRSPFASARGPSSRRGTGFTLLEVLVAVFVLGFALSAIIASTGRYAANAQVLREKTLALWVAHNRLTEIGLEPAWPSVGKSDGDEELAGLEWRWDVTVAETPDPRVRRVDITVRPKDREDGQAAALSSFVAERSQ